MKWEKRIFPRPDRIIYQSLVQSFCTFAICTSCIWALIPFLPILAMEIVLLDLRIERCLKWLKYALTSKTFRWKNPKSRQIQVEEYLSNTCHFQQSPIHDQRVSPHKCWLNLILFTRLDDSNVTQFCRLHSNGSGISVIYQTKDRDNAAQFSWWKIHWIANEKLEAKQQNMFDFSAKQVWFSFESNSILVLVAKYTLSILKNLNQQQQEQ